MKSLFFSIIFTGFLFADRYNFAPKILDPPYEKNIVIIVPSYNNEKYYRKNLDSICFQNYTNYRILYLDDASTDNTLELVTRYIKTRGVQDKITLMHNEENFGAPYNLYALGQMAADEEIVVTVDGDDWLPHKDVLKRVNEAYHDERVWMTYGTWKGYPDEVISYTHPVLRSLLQSGGHRNYGFIWSHLRTYYGGLFKKLPVSIFLDDNGDFIDMAGDVAIMINLIDLAHEHVYFMPDITYTYNRINPISEYTLNNKHVDALEKMIKEREPLEKLTTWK